MSDKSAIEWTDATWNPVTGCTKVSPGCDHCYAETLAERFRGTAGHYYEDGFDVQLRPAKLDLPLHWAKPRRVFVNSMSDLFHDQVPDDYIAEVFAVMAAARQHTFQLLTKRHARMRSLLSSEAFFGLVSDAIVAMDRPVITPWPLPNVWLGVSVENQQWADIRIPALIDTPAAVKWLSCEPLLGPVDLRRWLWEGHSYPTDYGTGIEYDKHLTYELDWVVVGGESGRDARPMHPDWARSIRDQCQEAGVAFLFKQWGEWAPGDQVNGLLVTSTGKVEYPSEGDTYSDIPREYAWMRRHGKKAAGRELDGRTWDQYPEVRQCPA